MTVGEIMFRPSRGIAHQNGAALPETGSADLSMEWHFVARWFFLVQPIDSVLVTDSLPFIRFLTEGEKGMGGALRRRHV